MGRQAIEPGRHGQVWVEQMWAKGTGNPPRTRPERVKDSGPRPKRGEAFWRARVTIRERNGAYREMSRRADGQEAARRKLQKALDDWGGAGKGDTVDASWTVERLAAEWLRHREQTGLVKERGELREGSIEQMRVTVRTVILGDRKTRINGEWQVVKREGGIPDLRLREVTRALLQHWLAELEAKGRSTQQVRTILTQMFDLAVLDGALVSNPMSLVAPPKRVPKEVQALTVEQARVLRVAVSPDVSRVPGRRKPSPDLAEVIDFCLATGCRIGEVLGVRWADLRLDVEPPTVHICGTLLEPRGDIKLSRQSLPKGGEDRTLILPEAIVEMLRERRRRLLAKGRPPALSEAVFATRTGHWMSPANIRARLRDAVAKRDDLPDGITPHTLRRTVGTAIGHEMGIDAARWQLGHRDPSLTAQVYVAARPVAPDTRPVLRRFFEEGQGRDVVPFDKPDG